MSAASDKGVALEKTVAKILRQKLNVEVQRDRRSGAGDTNKMDLRDRYWNSTRMAIECKNQANLQLKPWWRQTKQSASMGQIPTLVFKADDETLATVPFDELVNLVAEIQQLERQLEDLRRPGGADLHVISARATDPSPAAGLAQVGEQKVEQGIRTCRSGHLVDEWGYCSIKTCAFRRGYRLPKAKR